MVAPSYTAARITAEVGAAEWPVQYVGSAPDITNVYMQIARSLSTGDWVTLQHNQFTVTPSVWSSAGQQTITFSTTSYYNHDYRVMPSPLTVSATVNVISSEPAEKIIINAELYEETEVPSGYSVTFPASMSGKNSVLSINEGEAQDLYKYAGQIITGVETITVTGRNSTYSINSANIAADVSFYQEHDDGDRTSSGTTNSLVLSAYYYYRNEEARHLIITPLQNTVFSNFTVSMYKSRK